MRPLTGFTKRDDENPLFQVEGSNNPPPPPPPGPPPPRRSKSANPSVVKKTSNASGPHLVSPPPRTSKRSSAVKSSTNIGLIDSSSKPPSSRKKSTPSSLSKKWKLAPPSSDTAMHKTTVSTKPSKKHPQTTFDSSNRPVSLSDYNKKQSSWASFDESVAEKSKETVSVDAFPEAEDFFPYSTSTDTDVIEDNLDEDFRKLKKKKSKKKEALPLLDEDDKGSNTLGKVKNLFRKSSKREKLFNDDLSSPEVSESISHSMSSVDNASKKDKLNKSQSIESTNTGNGNANHCNDDEFEAFTPDFTSMNEPSQTIEPSVSTSKGTLKPSERDKASRPRNIITPPTPLETSLFPAASFSPPRFDPSPTDSTTNKPKKKTSKKKESNKDLTRTPSPYPDPEVTEPSNFFDDSDMDSTPSADASELTNPTFVNNEKADKISSMMSVTSSSSLFGTVTGASNQPKTRPEKNQPQNNNLSGAKSEKNDLDNSGKISDTVSPTWNSTSGFFSVDPFSTKTMSDNDVFFTTDPFFDAEPRQESDVRSSPKAHTKTDPIDVSNSRQLVMAENRHHNHVDIIENSSHQSSMRGGHPNFPLSHIPDDTVDEAGKMNSAPNDNNLNYPTQRHPTMDTDTNVVEDIRENTHYPKREEPSTWDSNINQVKYGGNFIAEDIIEEESSIDGATSYDYSPPVSTGTSSHLQPTQFANSVPNENVNIEHPDDEPGPIPMSPKYSVEGTRLPTGHDTYEKFKVDYDQMQFTKENSASHLPPHGNPTYPSESKSYEEPSYGTSQEEDFEVGQITNRWQNHEQTMSSRQANEGPIMNSKNSVVHPTDDDSLNQIPQPPTFSEVMMAMGSNTNVMPNKSYTSPTSSFDADELHSEDGKLYNTCEEKTPRHIKHSSIGISEIPNPHRKQQVDVLLNSRSNTRTSQHERATLLLKQSRNKSRFPAQDVEINEEEQYIKIHRSPNMNEYTSKMEQSPPGHDARLSKHSVSRSIANKRSRSRSQKERNSEYTKSSLMSETYNRISKSRQDSRIEILNEPTDEKVRTPTKSKHGNGNHDKTSNYMRGTAQSYGRNVVHDTKLNRKTSSSPIRNNRNSNNVIQPTKEKGYVINAEVATNYEGNTTRRFRRDMRTSMSNNEYSSKSRLRKVQDSAAVTIQSLLYINRAKTELARRRRLDVLNKSKNQRIRQNKDQKRYHHTHSQDQYQNNFRSSQSHQSNFNSRVDQRLVQPRANDSRDVRHSHAETKNIPFKTAISVNAKRPMPRRRSNFSPRKAYQSTLITAIPKGHPDQMIHMAGLRLISAAAIPIQTETRRYLAQQEAYARMWALITIQKYVRRWLSEDNLFAHIIAATKIQAVFRGWIERDSLDDEHYCATEIQRIVRGYLNLLNYHDDLCSIILVQSIARRNFAIDEAIDKLSSIIQIQALYRGYMTRKKHEFLNTEVVRIQKTWRRFSAQLCYQFDLVDIIIAQSIVRRRIAIKKTSHTKRSQNALIIQTRWRSYHQSITFLHTLADILIVQSVVRRWIACHNYPRMLSKRKNECAISIQRCWRGYSGHMEFLLSLVHIIVVQSIVRRFIARKEFLRALNQYNQTRESAATTIQKSWRGYVGYSNYVVVQFENQSATTIQRYWRGFWHYSHYVILQFEVIRIQGVFRGSKERQRYIAQRESAITMQSAIRMFLARRAVHMARMINILSSSKIIAFQTSICATKIQRWFRDYTSSQNKKAAALVIERFFIMVKIEVDKEIKRRKKKQEKKQEQRRRKKKEADEKLLERVWLNTLSVDQEIPASPSKSKQNTRHRVHEGDNDYLMRSRSTNRNQGIIPSYGQSQGHLLSNEYNRLHHSYTGFDRQHGRTNMNHKKEMKSPTNRQHLLSYNTYYPPTDHVAMQNDTLSEVSGITSPTFVPYRPRQQSAPASRFVTLSRKDLSDDYSLEEAWIDTEIHQVKEKRRNEYQYMQRHGLNPSHAYHEYSNPMQSNMTSNGITNRRSFIEDDDFDPITYQQKKGIRSSGSRSLSQDTVWSRNKSSAVGKARRQRSNTYLHEIHEMSSGGHNGQMRRKSKMDGF